MAKKEMSIAQLRNLPQYSGKTEEELIEIREKILYGDTEERIEKTVERIQSDYDISGMTANDELALWELARAFVTLEDLQKGLKDTREEANWGDLGKINREIHRIRKDISTLQDDLDITRKARKGSGEYSVVEFIEDLKKRGKKFLDERLSEIYCPECNMLIAKAWFLYPDADNELKLVCKRCDNVFSVESRDIERNKNIEIGPPF